MNPAADSNTAPDTAFAATLSKLDAVIQYPLASPTFLFALADALAEWSKEEAIDGAITAAAELSKRAAAAADAATATSRRSPS